MFLQNRDLYAILGVAPGAGHDAVRSAYRALARRYHPDLASSAEARRRMIEINRAWEILGDPTRRAQHDRVLRNGASVAAAGSTVAHSSPTGPSERDLSFRHEWMARHATDRQPTSGSAAGAKGPPPGNPSGSVLGFGIYLGWSLGEVVRVDPLYLEWLTERPEGRPYRDEIAAIRGQTSPAATKRARGSS